MNKDLVHSIEVKQALKAATIAASTDGITIDAQGYESITFNLNIGTPAANFDGTNKMTMKVQEGDQSDASDMADIAAGDYIESYIEGGTSGWDRILDATADKDKSYHIGVKPGTKRYRRIVVTEAGTVSVIMSSDCVLGSARHQPAAETQTP